jgi:hypothetical protein
MVQLTFQVLEIGGSPVSNLHGVIGLPSFMPSVKFSFANELAVSVEALVTTASVLSHFVAHEPTSVSVLISEGIVAVLVTSLTNVPQV